MGNMRRAQLRIRMGGRLVLLAVSTAVAGGAAARGSVAPRIVAGTLRATGSSTSASALSAPQFNSGYLSIS